MERRFTLGHILKLVKRIGEQYDTAVTAQAAAFGLGKPEADVVLFLSNNPGKDTARDLTEYRGFSKSYVSKALEPLLRGGYACIEPDADDRRVQHFQLTEKAAPPYEALRQVQDAFFSGLTRDISADELQVIRGALEKMLRNMGLEGPEQTTQEEP